jgi:hypothetical protein
MRPARLGPAETAGPQDVTRPTPEEYRSAIRLVRRVVTSLATPPPETGPQAGPSPASGACGLTVPPSNPYGSRPSASTRRGTPHPPRSPRPSTRAQRVLALHLTREDPSPSSSPAPSIPIGRILADRGAARAAPRPPPVDRHRASHPHPRRPRFAKGRPAAKGRKGRIEGLPDRRVVRSRAGLWRAGGCTRHSRGTTPEVGESELRRLGSNQK